MKTTIRLFATLREGRSREMTMDLPETATPKHVIDLLRIPEEDAALLLINGISSELGAPLRDADILAIFPPVGGG